MALWHFDEGGGNVAEDASGSSNNATFEWLGHEPGSGWCGGRFGGGIYLDGDDDFAVVESGIDLAGRSFTLEAWVWVEEGDGNQFIWGQGSAFSGVGLHVGLRDSNAFTFAFYNNDLDTADSFLSRVWQYWACTYDSASGERKIYLDGRGVAEDVAGPFTGSGPFYMGRAPWGGNFHGIIDEVRISRIPRTGEEIRDVFTRGVAMENGRAILALAEQEPDAGCVGLWSFEEGEGNTTEDLSAEENRGSIDGARWAAGLFGRSLMFDGDEEVDCGNDESLRSAETTVECWINPSDFEKNYQTIVAKSTKDQDGYAILMHDRGIVIEYSTSGFHRSIQKTNCLEPGRWYHLALTYSQDYMRGYIDGQEFNLINYHMEPPTSRPLTIGSGYDTGGVDGTQGFHGLIDSVQVYDRVLSAREIRRHSYIHRDNATLCSEVISVPPGNSWEAMHVSTILPYGTYLNVSVCDAATGEELINMTGRSEDRTTRLLAIHILEHSDIYLEARFTANRNASPILLNWGLNWTLITEPSLISEIGNQSLEEDSHDAHVVDLSLHFHDAYAVAGETQFQPVNLSDPGQMNLSFNGTWLVVDSLAENYTGTISLAIRCTNTYELWTLSNPFNITIIGTEDPPAWILPLPTVELDEDTNVTTNWSLSDYSLEADGDELSYSVASSSEVVKASVDPEHRLSVNATDDFFGRAELSVSVSQTNNGSIMARNATVAVIVNAVNDPPWTELLSPVNGHIQRNSGVTLQWNGFDLDDDKEDLSYDVYLGEEPSPSLHKEGVSGDTMIIDDLESGRTYYWHVIAHDGKAHGSSRNGTWNFTVDPDHFVPNTELVSPGNATVINTTTVNLTWELRRPGVGALSYRLYGGPSPSSLGEIHHTDMRWYVLRGLRDGISYYWTVIPVAGGVEGICPSGVWHFKVNKSFDSADLIKVKFEPASVELEQGESAMINMTLNNTSGDVVTARIRSVGNLSGLVHLPGSIVVGPREEITVGVRISNTSILLPSDYVVSIEVSHPGGWRTFSFPLKITEKDPNPNGGNGSGAGAGSTVSGLSDNLPLIILVCALSMALAVILIFFLRRSRKDESKEEAPDDHRAGKPEAKGALRVEDTPRTGGIRGPPLAMESPNEVQFAPELAPDGYSYVPSSVPGLPDATAESAGIPAGPTAVQDRAPASSQSGNEGLSWSPEPMPKGPQIVGVTGGFAIRDIFLIYVDGRLVESASFESHLRESMDQDIMSGMLTAITDFIKDSFKEDSGALKSLEYGKMNIYLERGVGMYIAVVFQGNPPEELREKMRWLLIRLWKEFKYKLKVWDGSMDGLEGLEKMLLSIMEEVEPEEEMTAAPAPSSASPADRVPILSKAEKAVMCGICMGVVKPGLVILNCPCGAKYHKTCGDRVDNCPKCGISLTGAKSEEEAGTMAKETVVEPVEEHIEELIDDPVGAADPVGEPVFPDFPPSGPYSDSIPSEVGLDTIFDLAAAPPTYGTPKDIAHPEMPPPPDVGSAGKIVPDPDAEVPLLPEETESRKAADEFKINV